MKIKAKKNFFIILIFIFGIFTSLAIKHFYYTYIYDITTNQYELLEKSMNEFVKDENGKITKNNIDVTKKYKETFLKLYNEKNFKELEKIITENNLSFGYKGE